MLTGRVAWFSRSFGFIRPDEEGKPDVFCHEKNIVMKGFRALSEGDYVEYEIGESLKGRVIAVNVRKRKDPNGNSASTRISRQPH